MHVRVYIPWLVWVWVCRNVCVGCMCACVCVTRTSSAWFMTALRCNGSMSAPHLAYLLWTRCLLGVCACVQAFDRVEYIYMCGCHCCQQHIYRQSPKFLKPTLNTKPNPPPAAYVIISRRRTCGLSRRSRRRATSSAAICGSISWGRLAGLGVGWMLVGRSGWSKPISTPILMPTQHQHSHNQQQHPRPHQHLPLMRKVPGPSIRPFSNLQHWAGGWRSEDMCRCACVEKGRTAHSTLPTYTTQTYVFPTHKSTHQPPQ